MDQSGKVANPARGQLNRENGYSSNPTIGGGREYDENIPYCMGNVAKKAPPGCGIEYPVSGWTSLPQTKLILAGVC